MKQNPWSVVLNITGAILDLIAVFLFVAWGEFASHNSWQNNLIPFCGVAGVVVVSFFCYAKASELKDLRKIANIISAEKKQSASKSTDNGVGA